MARGFHVVLDQQLGHIWLVQIGLAVGVTVLIGISMRGLLSRNKGVHGDFLGGLLLIWTVGWTSHSATAIDRLQGTIVDFAHIAGAGLWVGGLVVLGLVMPTLLSAIDREYNPRIAKGIIRRYSLLALSGVTLAAATGLLLAGWHVETLDGLIETVYGVALSMKTVLAMMALGLGGMTRYVLLRHLERPSIKHTSLWGVHDRDDPKPDGGQDNDLARIGTIVWVRRVIRFELGILIVVNLLSGLLTSVATPAVVTADEVEVTTIEREFNDDVVAEISVLPVLTGQGQENIVVGKAEPLVLEIEFIDDGERLESTETVRLLALDNTGTEIEIELKEIENGLYSTVQPLPETGLWELRITGSPDGMFGSVWFDIMAVPDLSEEEHDHGGGEGMFATAMRLGALNIGLIGSIAVFIEANKFRSDGTDR